MNNKNTRIIQGMFIALIMIMWVMGPGCAKTRSIIKFPNYKYAVAMCDSTPMPFVGKEHVIHTGRNYIVIINADHQLDPEINNLKAAALVACN